MKKRKHHTLHEAEESIVDLLNWVDENKKGFVRLEINDILPFLDELLKKTNLDELLEDIRTRIRRCIHGYWGKTQTKKRNIHHKKKTERSTVLNNFPEKLEKMLSPLSNVIFEADEETMRESVHNIRTAIRKCKFALQHHEASLRQLEGSGEHTGMIVIAKLEELLEEHETDS